MSRRWPAEREEILRARWDAGASADAIAAELGTTRNAIIGKADRLHLRPRKRTGRFVDCATAVPIE